MSILRKSGNQSTFVGTHSVIYLNKHYMVTQKWDVSMPSIPFFEMGVGLSQILTTGAHIMIFHHQIG